MPPPAHAQVMVPHRELVTLVGPRTAALLIESVGAEPPPTAVYKKGRYVVRRQVTHTATITSPEATTGTPTPPCTARTTLHRPHLFAPPRVGPRWALPLARR